MAGRPPRHPRSASGKFITKSPRKYAYHKNLAGWMQNSRGNIFQMFLRDELQPEFWDASLKQEFARSRAVLIAELTQLAWHMKQNCAEAISNNFGQVVLQPLVEEAQDNLHNDYLRFVQEEGNTKNFRRWPQADPSETDAFKHAKVQINGKDEEIWWTHGLGRTQIFGDQSRTGVFQTLGMKRIRYRFMAIDEEELDKAVDRPFSDAMTVRVAIPFYQRTAGASNKALLFLEALTGEEQGVDDYNKYVKILEFSIRGRSTERRLDRRTGKPWNLWRAIEYGQSAGNYRRVYVKHVTSFNEATDKTDRMPRQKGTSRVALASSIQTEGEWTVFMSPKWAWWQRQAVPINGEQVIMVDASANYLAGTAPIRRALYKGVDDSKVKALLSTLFDGALMECGLRRG